MRDPAVLNQQLLDLIADQIFVGVETLKPDTHFVNDLDFDDLDMVELFMAIEVHLKVSLSDNLLEKARTVKDLSLIVRKARSIKYGKKDQPA